MTLAFDLHAWAAWSATITAAIAVGLVVRPFVLGRRRGRRFTARLKTWVEE